MVIVSPFKSGITVVGCASCQVGSYLKQPVLMFVANFATLLGVPVGVPVGVGVGVGVVVFVGVGDGE